MIFALFLLYCPYSAKNILEEEYLNHICLLTTSLFLALECYISEQSILTIQTRIRKFLNQFENLYSRRQMSYNIHTLMHFAACVINHGSVYHDSSIMFEEYNRILGQLIQSPANVLTQLAKKYYNF